MMEEEYQSLLTNNKSSTALLDEIRKKMVEAYLTHPHGNEYRFWRIKYEIHHDKCVENAYHCAHY